MKEQQFLRIPGPTPIPPSVERAMIQPMIGHRSGDFKQLYGRLIPRLQPVFGTRQDVLVLAASGTAGLEAAAVNAVKEGEKVLVIVTGAFGERFTDICETYRFNVDRLDVTWGEAVKPDAVKAYLKKNPDTRAVFVTYCETSTAVLNPIEEIAQAVRETSDALVIADGVSCIGGTETEMDAWGIDILITGSQKAMMLPPGLVFIAASDRAWARIEANSQPRFYLDLLKYRKSAQDHSSPFTPAVSLLYGLEEALNIMEEEGLENVYKRHRLMKTMIRAAADALQLPLLTSEEAGSPTVTAIRPTAFDAEALRSEVKKTFSLTLAGGQKQLKGQIFRIGHMGYCSPADILQTITMLEIGLDRIGADIRLGTGTAAAQRVFLLEKGDNR
ncbi:pyridoxal-phosphate-dependent aminotransferase family protein [Planococcus lenghuensis]|uniref:Class V aminotransferase n=1 Tax=Planococcus lenghuensis TaxID=2213202 RepID=A0A1Q2KZJ3_9BACL|nr:alanine--glyoxylate aminotransferase family protein [Planococcus lenghuensis]AQQ53583.1 class V aminotransferase [Planococcus lenghuensis]